MKHFKLVSALLLFGYCFGYAQPTLTKKPVKLIDAENMICMNAEWSPAGDMIAFTSERNNGLFICNENGRKVRRVTNDLSAGFGYKWSKDGESILSRPLIVEQGKRFHEVAIYNVKTNDKKVVVDKNERVRMMPTWVDGDAAVAYNSSNGVSKAATGKPRLKSQKASSVADLGGQVVEAQKDFVLNNSGFEGRYVYNTTPSPDGKKIVFQVNGLGLYVVNADGSELKHLGHGEQASWMPDSKNVLVSKVNDNGVAITDASIECVNVVTGQSSVLLSDSEIIALNPSVSPDGTKVLIDNVKDGAVYMFEIKQ